jgi:hypothetical protein
MKRKDFINMTVLFAISSQLHLGIAEGEEIFRFDQSSLGPLLKNISIKDKETAVLMIRNLLFDMQYILNNTRDLKDAEALKKLAMAADNKFYIENKLTGKGFQYQPITFTALDELKKKAIAEPAAYDLAIRNLKNNINKIRTSGKEFKIILPEIFHGKDAAKQAEGKSGCARIWNLIANLLLAIILIIVAVVVAVFTYGSGGTAIALAIIAAGITSVASTNNSYIGPQEIVVRKNEIVLDNTKIPIDLARVDFQRANLDNFLKCSVYSVSTAMIMEGFNKTEYPANPLFGSLAVNLLSVVAKIEGIETVC